MAQTPDLEFFFDCSSPWTYLAFTQIIPMARRFNVDIQWRPIIVGGVFNAVNQQVYSGRAAFLSEDSPKLRYYFKDMADWARACDITLNWPKGHPINAVNAMRGALYAAEQDRLIPYCEAVFATYWSSDNPDISDDKVLLDICEHVGLDGQALLAATREQSYKDQLRANTDELIARGGFGSPTIFINGDDMYFGNDRLPLVEYRLQQLLSD